MIGTKAGDRIEGQVIVAFYRKRTKEKLVPMTETHRGMMIKLYEATCVIEKPFKLSEKGKKKV